MEDEKMKQMKLEMLFILRVKKNQMEKRFYPNTKKGIFYIKEQKQWYNVKKMKK